MIKINFLKELKNYCSSRLFINLLLILYVVVVLIVIDFVVVVVVASSSLNDVGFFSFI